jgi:hypothetical protein
MDSDRFLNWFAPPFLSLLIGFVGVRASTQDAMHHLMMSPYGSARMVTLLIPLLSD